MFSLAKNFVKSIEQSAGSIISGTPILESDPYFQNAGTTVGFRVLFVDENNPIAQELKLEPWFDYIVGINGHELLKSGSSENDISIEFFLQEIENCKGTDVSLQVWNAKGGILRQVIINNTALTESSSLGDFNENGIRFDGNAISHNKFRSLGISIQATPLITATFIYHVLDVYPNTPAEYCGLVPHSDFIIGANDGLFATGGEDLFSRVINLIYNRNPNDCKIKLIVYNHDFDVVRSVTIEPKKTPNGILGCGVGYGYLHRLPEIVGKYEAFDSQKAAQDFAPINSPNFSYTTAPATLQNIKSKRKKHPALGQPSLDDFVEHEIKSSAAKNVPSKPTTSQAIPPPPKKN